MHTVCIFLFLFIKLNTQPLYHSLINTSHIIRFTAYIYIRTTQWFILVIISNLMQILICYINFYIIYTSPCIYKNLILSTLYTHTHTHAHHMFFLFFFRPIVKLYAYVKFINIHVSHTTRTFFTSPSYNYQIEFH